MPTTNNSYDDSKYNPRPGVTAYVCSYCKIGRHDKCANLSQTLKGICGCVFVSCLAKNCLDKDKKEKENGSDHAIP